MDITVVIHSSQEVFIISFFSLIIFIEGSAKQPQIRDLKKNQIVKKQQMQKLAMVTYDKQNFKALESQLIFYGPNMNISLPKEIIVYQGFYQSILVIDQFSQPCFDEKTWLLFMAMVLETNRNVQQVSLIGEGLLQLGDRGGGHILGDIDYYHISIEYSGRITD